MNFGLAMLFLWSCCWITRHYWELLARDEQPWPTREWIGAWTSKGAWAPVLAWLLLNTGWLPDLPPLAPEVELAKAAGTDWFSPLLDVMAAAMVVIGWCWAVFNFLWLLGESYARLPAENREEFPGLALICALPFMPLAGGLAWFEAWAVVALCVVGWLIALAHFTLPQVPRAKPPPTYSVAIASIKRDKYAQAEWSILNELERAETDFHGWLLLAELYAVHHHDLKVADDTIHELCAQPNLSMLQIDQALHRLADWHLKLGADPAPARRALEEISQRLPGTHFDRMARQRLAQLPASAAELLAERQPKTIRLPGAPEPVTPAPLAEPPADPAARQAEAMRLVNQCLEELKREPASVGARERLARLYAEQLGQVDQAIEQLDPLLSAPEHPELKRAEWLSWIARWQFSLRRDPQAAKGIWELLVAQYPQTPYGFDAQRRLSLLAAEARWRRR